MTHRDVGIYADSDLRYSTEWIKGDTFPEKRALQELARLMGYDDGNLLSRTVKACDRVVIKPNWVRHFHPAGGDLFSLITHSAVIRALVDMAYDAMQGQGEIIIADAPQWDCDFSQLLDATQVQCIADYYKTRHNFAIIIRDLRQIGCIAKDKHITSVDRTELDGDPEGYAVVNLGQDSAFVGMPHVERMYGADYDRKETIRHHNDERHEYLVSKTMLHADVVINVPKLKVHKKVGVTLNAKSMVGINGNKNWIAHYRIGPPSRGGDEYPDTESTRAKAKASVMRFLIDHLLAPESPLRERAFKAIRRVYKWFKPLVAPVTDTWVSIDAGDWYGNDTAWRMTADLARAIIYADKEGRLHDTPQRRFFSVIDGVTGGDLEGPLKPDPVQAGVLIASTDLLAADLVGTRMMGFDWKKVRSIAWLVRHAPVGMSMSDPHETIRIASNRTEWASLMRDASIADLRFRPHPGWTGHLELESPNR